MTRNISLLFVCAALACGGGNDLEASMSVNGVDKPLDTFGSALSDAVNGELLLTIDLFSDPIENAADDELGLTINLVMSDFGVLPIGTPVSINDGITANFSYSCNCPPGATTPGVVSGTVTFDALSNEQATGEASLTLTGADANTVDLGETLVQIEFDAVRQ